MTNLTPAAQAYLDSVGNGVGVKPVAWTSDVKPAAANKARRLRKRVSATVLTGVEYAKLAVNDERETGSLPWGQWLVYPFLIEHKGTIYARVYTVEGTVKAATFVDDREVSRADFDALLTPGARESKRPHGGTLTVKVDSLTVLA